MTVTNSLKSETDKPVGDTNPVKKIVIRHLPPTLTKEQFLDIVSPLPEYDYFYYCNADLSLGQNSFCRAYICFKNHQDVFNFRDRFDNYIFVDSKSNEYPAIVEYAPYQRRFKLDAQNPPKKDSKCNTIDQDSDYLKFLEQFDKPSGDQLPSCEAILEELEQKEKEKLTMGLLSGTQAAFAAPKVMTPLLEYMRKKREDKKSSKDRDRDRDRDRRRRDRDRDDDKRYTGGYGGGGNKRRDDYYYGSNYQSNRDYNKNQSNSSSSQKLSQQKVTILTKNESKIDSSNVKILNKSQQQHQNISTSSTTSKNESESKSNTTTKGSNSQQTNKDIRASSSSSNNYKSSSNYGNYNRNNNNNYSSSNRNSQSGQGSKNTETEKQFKDKEKNSGSNSVSTNKQSAENSSKEEKANRDQGDKSVKNRDRPSIQIYNPAQRAAMRQQKNQNS